MARPLRILYPGAIYHVTVRGNRKKNIFETDYDRNCLLSILGKTVESRNIICHAYCLMPNHFHLLIETPEANLSSAMHDINGEYTQFYNKIHNTVGHLFQGRFKSFLIEKESYLLEVARYTVLNPVRAGLVKRPEDWKWSSYKATAGIVRAPKWLKINWILEFFNDVRKCAQGDYKQFVYDGIEKESPFKDVGGGNVLGSGPFIGYISTLTEHEIKNEGIPKVERIIGRPTLGEIFEDINNIQDRNKAICFARYNCGYSNIDIAGHVKLSCPQISRITQL